MPTEGDKVKTPQSEKRFEFGKNWRHFLATLDDERIARARSSLQDMLAVDSLVEKTFLDVGSGSGLFSLAARQLGAEVYSFDYDADSVACTVELKRRYFPEDVHWRIEQGDVLDVTYLGSLGQFDVVYAWGVLHHTGAMWEALGNVVNAASSGGKIFVAIYNDQGLFSVYWKGMKRTYNGLPKGLKSIVLIPVFLQIWAPATVRDFLFGRPFHTWRTYQTRRGMSAWQDVVDWAGGYPFEVSKPEAVFNFCQRKGCNLERLKTCGGKLGCNEFVFRKLR